MAVMHLQVIRESYDFLLCLLCWHYDLQTQGDGTVVIGSTQILCRYRSDPCSVHTESLRHSDTKHKASGGKLKK